MLYLELSPQEELDPREGDKAADDLDRGGHLTEPEVGADEDHEGIGGPDERGLGGLQVLEPREEEQDTEKGTEKGPDGDFEQRGKPGERGLGLKKDDDRRGEEEEKGAVGGKGDGMDVLQAHLDEDGVDGEEEREEEDEEKADEDRFPRLVGHQDDADAEDDPPDGLQGREVLLEKDDAEQHRHDDGDVAVERGDGRIHQADGVEEEERSRDLEDSHQDGQGKPLAGNREAFPALAHDHGHEEVDAGAEEPVEEEGIEPHPRLDVLGDEEDDGKRDVGQEDESVALQGFSFDLHGPALYPEWRKNKAE